MCFHKYSHYQVCKHIACCSIDICQEMVNGLRAGDCTGHEFRNSYDPVKGDLWGMCAECAEAGAADQRPSGSCAIHPQVQAIPLLKEYVDEYVARASAANSSGLSTGVPSVEAISLAATASSKPASSQRSTQSGSFRSFHSARTSLSEDSDDGYHPDVEPGFDCYSSSESSSTMDEDDEDDCIVISQLSDESLLAQPLLLDSSRPTTSGSSTSRYPGFFSQTKSSTEALFESVFRGENERLADDKLEALNQSNVGRDFVKRKLPALDQANLRAPALDRVPTVTPSPGFREDLSRQKPASPVDFLASEGFVGTGFIPPKESRLYPAVTGTGTSSGITAPAPTPVPASPQGQSIPTAPRAFYNRPQGTTTGPTLDWNGAPQPGYQPPSSGITIQPIFENPGGVPSLQITARLEDFSQTGFTPYLPPPMGMGMHGQAPNPGLLPPTYHPITPTAPPQYPQPPYGSFPPQPQLQVQPQVAGFRPQQPPQTFTGPSFTGYRENNNRIARHERRRPARRGGGGRPSQDRRKNSPMRVRRIYNNQQQQPRWTQPESAAAAAHHWRTQESIQQQQQQHQQAIMHQLQEQEFQNLQQQQALQQQLQRLQQEEEERSAAAVRHQPQNGTTGLELRPVNPPATPPVVQTTILERAPYSPAPGETVSPSALAGYSMDVDQRKPESAFPEK
ncbi:hypothetical protein ASPACDRAFT_1887189 [Aspergillus aculeatus ATCC 16872]|uniref:Uncharacterized protein n=1 Tax=Aspergillus aculeatus (strain ATCC 16872 / CBS 172.66 / WB 5094) TaxID=690307 RepID=A0A1L9WZH2_ASPA1|nr:uncharacterized protein ASPACDRAFT_1887189 [Aspergillus aculeatus ATCC 16872]OJK01544.1 hypothetical protein ASPACDRAFT_1887189 [Aspergillus aculeatus ATCC 16872]